MKIDKEKVMNVLVRKRWTFSDLAKNMGMTKQLVSLRISGRQVIRLKTLYAFADILGVKPEDIII